MCYRGARWVAELEVEMSFEQTAYCTAHTVWTLFVDNFFEFGQGKFRVEGFFQSSISRSIYPALGTISWGPQPTHRRAHTPSPAESTPEDNPGHQCSTKSSGAALCQM